MKPFRLLVHQKTFSEEDLIINPKDFPEGNEGDIVEIYHTDAESDNPRLLLQIKLFKDDLLTKDSVSIEQSIALAFGLQAYKHQTVCVRIVNPNDVALDSVEVTFKDQYMGRSEMWRLKKCLTDTCVYMNKKIEFCGGAIRCQVHEMWCLGDRVACGVINDETKIVFRSSTSLVYLFLQMSSEMWDFDIYGDLYFEKTVNGFLTDLFQKWKKNGSNHEVTIVLFSRTFYQANNLEEFPEHMRECLQQDYRGRYYEDFYRVVCQNEKFDDWSAILVQLRRLFAGYLKVVLEYHSRPGVLIPLCTNSTAAQGNFLEVLNMSLNVFEKHYLDRSFDRTGQLSVVVTPGVGVFEVDRELTNVTKQRIIDNGVGSDLVCVGEQPLHAVPLLKFHNKDSNMNVPDDYSMPHWINLSFYSSNKKIAYSNFIPRIKFPPMPNKKQSRIKEVLKPKLVSEEEYLHNSFFDYDAYDAQVFQLPSMYGSNNRQRSSARFKKTSGSLLDPQEQNKIRRKFSDPNIRQAFESPKKSQAVPIISTPVSPVITHLSGNNEDKNWIANSDKDFSPPPRLVVGSAGSPPAIGLSNEPHRSKALINPFDPSHVTIKLTSNRRRWTHIFPKGPTGVLIQQHHYQAIPTQSFSLQEQTKVETITSENCFANCSDNYISTTALLEYCKKRPNHHNSNSNQNATSQAKNSRGTLLWGATGEQEWTPALTTGVDWKSLTIPACLPITTDYFPDKRALQVDYLISLYHLLPDDVNADFAQQRANYKKPLSTVEVFRELVSQRLAQGFQLILIPNKESPGTYTAQTSASGSLLLRKRAETEPIEAFYLSIGRIFHKISLSGNAITVTRYRPRHPYPSFNIHYRYRFQAPYHETYEVSWVSFTTEKLENYHWNYLDHYICTRGDTDFQLVEALKYWRFRIYLLPLNNSATKKIVEGAPHYDIYVPSSDQNQIAEGFLKFIETAVNKIKRTCTSKKPRMSLSMPNNASLIQQRRLSLSAIVFKNEALNQNAVNTSPFRERLGSNRLPERPISRTRSGSKGLERGRNSPAVDTTSQTQIVSNDSVSHENSDDSSFSQEIHLRYTATPTEIVEALRHPMTGLNILSGQPNLPSTTFIAGDAVNWLISNMEGISTIGSAVKVMESLQKEQLICHASGDSENKFTYGFFLFYFTQVDKDDSFIPAGDLQSFENEWMEVEMRSALNWGISMSTPSVNVRHIIHDRETGVPHFLCEDIDIAYLQGDLDFDCPIYKSMYLDVDFSSKSDRVEWGHARYQTIFRPDQAYEIVVEWLVASGSIIAELLFSWHRKAQTCGLQIIPIPHDPLALPYSNKSDPLRGPIFVPLNTKCLMEKHKSLFEEFREDTWIERMFLFQEAILSKFGFISCVVQQGQKSQGTPVCQEHQYIHCTGTVFILVPSPIPRLRSRLTSINQRRTGSRYPSHIDIAPSPHEAYITRHVSGKNKDDYDPTKKVGFLWSWNHMISRRWRTNQAVDYNFQVKMLKDFREFCSNFDNRLKTYWDKCWEIKEDSCTKST